MWGLLVVLAPSLNQEKLKLPFSFRSLECFFLILNRIAMWVFDTRMYTVSHTRLYEAAIAYPYGGSLKTCTLLCSFLVTNCKKKPLIPLSNWYVEMDIPNQHGYVCGWWIPYVIRWDQIHMTMWNEADIFRRLLDFVVSIQLAFIYLLLWHKWREFIADPKTTKECGSSQPQTHVTSSIPHVTMEDQIIAINPVWSHMLLLKTKYCRQSNPNIAYG
jgi:hypothetical protein